MPVAKDYLKLRQQYATGLASLEALHDRLREMADARENRSGSRPMPPAPQEIVFENVEFVYPTVAERSGTRALANIDLTIPARQLTALIGPSGAGKSTLIDMLPRMRQPTSGRILISGQPLNEIDIVFVRASIAFVPQAPRILGATPREHIRYGVPSASEREVEEAARLTGAHEFISRLHQGYDTELGEEGQLLSGGERQRLDLARALVRKASILVLDEPTSHLDATSEAHLQVALGSLRDSGRVTIIVIAHRLTTIVQADQIVVLREGHIEATGRHDDLLVKSSWYADAFARQMGGAEPNIGAAAK
jgi:ABC-type multidrug transport system fused ATPase/permease subunit